MTKYQYELHIDIYLMSRLLFYAPFSGDGCGECVCACCDACDDHPAGIEIETEPETEPVASAVPVVGPETAFVEETE
jgi:hypothetical protein